MRNLGIWWTVAVVIGVGFLFYQRGWRIAPPQSEPVVRENNDTPPPERGRVAGVIDAFTLQLNTGHIIRYLGVRVPSIGKEVQCYGKEALLAQESIVGKEIRMEEDPVFTRSRDGAWMRYVFFEEAPSPSPSVDGTPPQAGGENMPEGSVDEGEEEPEGPDEIFVSERIIETGLGWPHVSQEMTYGDRLVAAGRYATATGKGLWSQCEVEKGEQDLLITQAINDCVIKGKLLPAGTRVYRTPECAGYAQTLVLRSNRDSWLCSEEEAKTEGWQKAEDCE